MNIDLRHDVWVEKFRPQVIDDLVIPEDYKKFFKKIVETKTVPHLLLSGIPGTGKTASIVCLAKELGADILIINGSADRGIEVIRVDIDRYITTVSLKKNNIPKIVIIDESNLTSQAYDALRHYIEKNHLNARFFITTNYPQNIPDPILSRMEHLHYGYSSDLLQPYAQRLANIWKNESGKTDLSITDKKILSTFAKKHFPDMRKALNILQHHFLVNEGNLTEELLVDTTNWLSCYYACIKKFDYKKIFDLLNDPIINDQDSIFSQIYDSITNVFKPESIPDAILIISKYQFQSKYDFNKKITFAAMACELKNLFFL